jgi:hypothetical protein
MPDQSPEACQHPTAYVIASIGDPGNDDPDASGLPWQQEGCKSHHTGWPRPRGAQVTNCRSP